MWINANCGLCQWRNEITLHFQHGYGEKIPVMMLGLKRDLRVEGEGVIYPQEVLPFPLLFLFFICYDGGADIDRHIALRRNCAVIGMRSVRLLQGSCLRRRLRIFRGWGLWRGRGRAGRAMGVVVFYSGFLLWLWLILLGLELVL